MTIKSPPSHHRKVTERELRTMRQMREEGYAPATIAERLGLSSATVSRYTRGILKAKARGW